MQSSREMIEEVARRLGPLREHVTFLGGAVMTLLVSDPAAPEVRATEDVDVVVKIATRAAYYRMEEELLRLGFTHSQKEGDPVCRWSVANVVVDVMPTDEAILGFGNLWYLPAIAQAQTITLSSGLDIQVITAPYFLATKLEAFRGRGKGDFLGSADIADIISILDGRPELVSEVQAADTPLRQYLARSFGEYRPLPAFTEAIAGHLLPDAASQARMLVVLNRINQIIAA